MSEENFHPQIEILMLRMMRDADKILGGITSICDKGKALCYRAVFLLVPLFVAEILSPYPWNLLLLVPVILIGVLLLSKNGALKKDYEKLMSALKFLLDEIDEISPLFRQEAVAKWQWDDLVKRKETLLKFHGLLK